ncbi:uncharacterized protein LOC125684320 isoform X6 [Lagopus muta]|uniref:uncharacterized protein LOC125684320 isoform X5 n=1 Tax=Lagopus muta TaxID=64668 RepID=UPI00209EBFFA|nr:uncharacterized protein LOC125684320 isoform X5 [Lagopus muta]XP_048782358.1 uncharacterized protein LOC125684320 isoform X5 [Lagopus muta]XP_048782360.1 uncharacterized protein LOC125684320 isoform X6 [Lagopus muta]
MHSIAKESQARVAAKSRRIQTNSVKSRRAVPAACCTWPAESIWKAAFVFEGRRNQRCCSLCSGKAALATLWRREPLRLPFGPCLSPTCQQSSQVLSVKYQSGVLLLSLGWMPEISPVRKPRCSSMLPLRIVSHGPERVWGKLLSASQLPTWQLCNLHNSATQLRRRQRVMESCPQPLGAEVAAGKAGQKSLAACRAGAPQASQGKRHGELENIRRGSAMS